MLIDKCKFVSCTYYLHCIVAVTLFVYFCPYVFLRYFRISCTYEITQSVLETWYVGNLLYILYTNRWHSLIHYFRSTSVPLFCLFQAATKHSDVRTLNVRWWRGLDPSSSTIAQTEPQWWIVTRAPHGSWYDYHMSVALQWRHNERDCFSNHHPRDCLLNRLSRRRSNKTSKVRVTGLCVVNSPVTGEFPA